MQNVGVMTNSRRGKTKEIEGKLIVGAAGRNAHTSYSLHLSYNLLNSSHGAPPCAYSSIPPL